MQWDHKKTYRWFTTLLKSAIVLSITLCLIEVGAYLWLTRVANDTLFSRFATRLQLYDRMQQSARPFTRHQPHRYIGFVASPNYLKDKNQHNAMGFRDDPIDIPKPPGEFRIVCIGGSTTYTTFVSDYKNSYPLLMQEKLRQAGHTNIRVINAGTPAYTSFESLVNFEFRILDLEPDMIVVYHAINDVINRMVWPPEAYKGDNSGSMPHSAGFFKPIPLVERSNAVRILSISLGLGDAHAELLRCFIDFPSTAYWSQFVYQYDNGLYPQGIFKEVPALEMLKANPPVYYRRNLESLLALARHHGIEPVLATFMLCTKKEGHNSSPEFQYGIAEHNEELKELAGDMDVPLFDFAEVFPNDPELFVDPDHVNEEGARRKAQLFAQFLLESNLLPVPEGGIQK
jgi:lysophospholipase L1-like esterase